MLEMEDFAKQFLLVTVRSKRCLDIYLKRGEESQYHGKNG